MKVGLPLMTNVLSLLAKSMLMPAAFTAAASADDSGIHETKLGSWTSGSGTTALFISNEEIRNILKKL